MTMGRRSFLKSAVKAGAAASLYAPLVRAAAIEGGALLAPLPAHHPAKAQNLILIDRKSVV